MHELSIACSIIEIVEENLPTPDSRAVMIRIRIGVLAGVDRAALLFGFEVAAEGTRAASAKLVVEDVEVRVRCRACGSDSTPPSLPILQCACCGELTGEVLQGRELEVIAVEIDDGKSEDC